MVKRSSGKSENMEDGVLCRGSVLNLDNKKKTTMQQEWENDCSGEKKSVWKEC